jgi:hypothetical protein
MKLRQIVALVLVAACLIFSGLALIHGEFGSAALGVFVSSCALITNFGNGLLDRFGVGKLEMQATVRNSYSEGAAG